MQLSKLLAAAFVIGPLFSSTPTALAWHAPGHHHCVLAGLNALPDAPGADDLPGWLDEAAGLAAHAAQDPDLMRHDKLPQAKAAEHSNHFFDLEYLGDAELPNDRNAFNKWCYDHDLDPGKVGHLPYALAESAQMLTFAFAEHRAWPDNPYLKMKIAFYMGRLSHYAADACQPLHTTIHYNGRVAKAGDPSPNTGIHLKVDGVLDSLPAEAWTIDPASIKDLGPVLDAAMAHIRLMNRRVDALYDIADRVPAKGEPITDGAVREAAHGWARASSRFFASLVLTAWNDSAGIKLPEWHNRDLDQTPGRDAP